MSQEYSLYEYGIQNEKSDIRAHVCPLAQRVYVYPTERGQMAVASGKYPIVDGYQKGVTGRTSKGCLVPPLDIGGCVSVAISPRFWDHVNFDKDWTTSKKGATAMRLVCQMVRLGMFPFPGQAQEVTDRDLQFDGHDLLICGLDNPIAVQVKCDFTGGEKELGGSSNLFLQVAERNPLGKH